MPQNSPTVNHMFGFKGTHCANPKYQRVRYKKWPWISFLVATVCIGVIFFIAGSPANIHQMNGGSLVLCSILLGLGTILLVPSAVIVFYLFIYYMMVQFKCSARHCCGRPIEWAKEKNLEFPEDEFLMAAYRTDVNDNPTTSSKNKKKQDQSSGSRKKPEELSVPTVIVHSNNVNHLPPDTHKGKRPYAQSSVYSVQTDKSNSHPDSAYHQRKIPEQNYNYIYPNHYSGQPYNKHRDRKGVHHDGTLPRRGRPDGEGGAGNGIDNASYDSNDDVDSSYSQAYHPPSVHSYNTNRSINGPYDNRRTSKGVYGVSRTPDLAGQSMANDLKKSKNPPSNPNPPIDARVNVVNHPVKYSGEEKAQKGVNSSPKSSRSQPSHKTARDSTQDQDRSRMKTPKNTGKKNAAMEMGSYSDAPRKTLMEQAKEGPTRPRSQVRGYRSTDSISGYLETAMNDSRSGSSMSGKRRENVNVNNNHRSKPSRAH